MTAPATPAFSPAKEHFFSLRQFIIRHNLPFIRRHRRSWKIDEHYLVHHVLPYLGMHPLEFITTKFIENGPASLKKTGLSDSLCHRKFWLPKYVLNCAICWIPGNDALFQGAKKSCMPSRRSPYLLFAEEMRQLMGLFKEYEAIPGTRAIHLLLPAGAGKSESLSARREDVYVHEHLSLLRRSCSGRQKILPTTRKTALIRALPRKHGGPWLFSSPTDGRLMEPFHSWNFLRTRRGRTDLKFQDLRHSSAGLFLHRRLLSSDICDTMGNHKTGTLTPSSQPSFLKKELS